ncbi:MAG: hypothetical protein IJL87_08620 [Clostridia bacterium]|nr:hypothetical protein [Clostridia bacterium]
MKNTIKKILSSVLFCAMLSTLALFSGCNEKKPVDLSGISNDLGSDNDKTSEYSFVPAVLGCNADANSECLTLDLDGDGETETVSFTITKDSSLSWTQETNFDICINEARFQLDSFFKLAVYDENGNYVFNGIPDNLIYAVDIDKSDSFIEIVVAVPVEYRNFGTYFYRYNSGAFYQLGYVDGVIGHDSFSYDGKFTAVSPLLNIVDWYGNKKYTLESSGTFSSEEGYLDGMADPSLSANENRELLKVNIISDMLFVYPEPDMSLRADVLEPCTLYLLGTDNSDWVKCENGKHTVYWFKCSENNESGDIFLNDMGQTPEEIFSGLYRRTDYKD